ncbi:MAG: flagellin [Roseomonas sp.]|nr:flagellin [Roseomonas sp.]MCA3291624.1 flagellin [Roseomonas sp.]MCA3293994.1 flagellin [Roseomonas sp.]MCA3343041.1 flagellin [Roseomonas sp.]
MSFNSVNTNRQAVFALQSLNQTNSELGFVQKRVSTGFRVADARDDGGAFAVAQAVRSDMAGVTAVGEQLGGTRGILSTTFASLSVVSDTMKQARAVLTRLADAAVTGASRTQYETQYGLLVNQIGTFINDAFYNGRTLLSTAGPDGGDIVSIRNESGGTFTILAVDGEGLKLNSTAPTSSSIAVARLAPTTGDFDVTDAAVSDALNRFGAQMQFVDNQIVYNSKKIDAMDDGLGALVDADLAKESSRLQALQTRQQLGVQTLGIANQGPQVLLSLFR